MIPVCSIALKKKNGGTLFNPDDPYGAIASAVTSRQDEIVVTKFLPNAFADTQSLKSTRRKSEERT